MKIIKLTLIIVFLILFVNNNLVSQVYINTSKKSNDTIKQIIKNKIREVLDEKEDLITFKLKFIQWLERNNSLDTTTISETMKQKIYKCQSILNSFKEKDSIIVNYNIEKNYSLKNPNILINKNPYSVICHIYYPLLMKDNELYMIFETDDKENILGGYMDIVKYESPLINCDGN